MYCSQFECGIYKLNGCYYIFEYFLREIFDKVIECCFCMKFILFGIKCIKFFCVKVKFIFFVNYFILEIFECGGLDEFDGIIFYLI